MANTSIRSTIPIMVNRQGNRRDDLDARNIGQGVIKGITLGGPLGGLIGMVVLTLAIPALGSGAMLAGMIVGIFTGIVLGAFGGLYTRARAYDAAARPAQAHATARALRQCSAD